MAGSVSLSLVGPRRRSATEPFWVRVTLLTIAGLFLALFLLMPLWVVVSSALKEGLGGYVRALGLPDTVSAIRLTLLVTGIAVPINVAFGLAAAWAIARFEFRGKALLVSLIDLPFSVSPVVAGMLFVLLFGAQGIFGPWLAEHGIRVIFAVPGLVLATLFVTFPFVTRELIPILEAQGPEQDLAALTLGAGPLRTAWHVTLPNVRWGLLYGTLLCTARALGEFGAVSVVSGHVRGRTNTLPLHIETLYNEYQFTAAWAVSSLLVGVAVVTLVARKVLEWQIRRSLRSAQERVTAGGAP